jgi:hypothetical protein
LQEEGLIKPEKLVGVSYRSEIAFEVFESDDHSASTVVGMKGKRLVRGFPIIVVVEECSIEEEVDMMLRVVDEAERRNAARFESQVFHHAFRRSEGELSARWLALCLKCSLQPSLKVVDVEVVVAMEADEIVLIALVVAHEDVFAMHRAIVVPPALGFLYGLAFRMLVTREGNVVLPKETENFFLSF